MSVEEDGSHVKRRDAQAGKDFFEILPYAIYGQGDIKYKTDPVALRSPRIWGLYVMRWTGDFYAVVRGAPSTSQIGSTLEFTITATDDSYDPDDPDTQGKITYTLIVTVTEPTHE